MVGSARESDPCPARSDIRPIFLVCRDGLFRGRRSTWKSGGRRRPGFRLCQARRRSTRHQILLLDGARAMSVYGCPRPHRHLQAHRLDCQWSCGGRSSAGPAYVAIGGSGNGICRGVEPVTCLDGAHAALMTRYRTEIARIVEALPENLRPSYWSSDPRFVKHGGDTILAPPVAGYMYPAHTIDAAMFVARVGDALFVGPCISSGRGSDTAMTLVAWWRLSHGINPSTAAYPGDTNFPPAWDAGFDRRMSRAREFAALSRADRDAWLSAHASEIRTCRAPEPGL